MDRYRKTPLEAQYAKYRSMPCAVCGLTGDIEIDHTIPLAIGGVDDESNWQPLCYKCNRKKGCTRDNLYLIDWVRRNGIDHFIDGVLRERLRSMYRHLDYPDVHEVKRKRCQYFYIAQEFYDRFTERHGEFNG